MKVLLSAFGFSPYRGSEAAVGWNIARELAKLHDVTVLTGSVKDMPDDYARYVAENGPVKGLTVEYIRPTSIICALEWLHRLPGCWGVYYLAYNFWQRKAYRCALQLCQQRKFDIVHQLNMIGYREPGYLWKLGIPFVWGPVGGAPNEPIAYHSLFSWSGCVKVALRSMINEFQKHICWRAKRAARRAETIWAVTDADYRMIHDLWGVEGCQRMIEAGADEGLCGVLHTWDGDSPVRMVWSGIHTSRKALPILLYALARLEPISLNRVRVEILGEGPETDGWKKLAVKLNVDKCLSWHGRIPRDQALDVMRSAHLLACSSIKEASSIVVIEAVSLGLPVVCHDACGMGIVVNEKCGIKVPLLSPEMSIAGFAAAIMRVMSCPREIEKLSQGALARAKELTWGAKAREISDAYAQVGKINSEVYR